MKKNSLIGIVAPSGPLRTSTLEEIESTLTGMGYRVKFGKTCSKTFKGYLAGEDKLKVKDIEDMFKDTSVDLIMCLRGGYGAMRIIDMIDFSVIKNNPKPFIGFSDITALHIAIYSETQMPTYHGIMAQASPNWDESSYKSLLEAVNSTEEYELLNPSNKPFDVIVEGFGEGVLVGGNLALVVSSLGTKHEIDTKGKVLFLEDIGESIYRLDRMFTQLILANKIQECSGIILGDYCDCNKSNEGDFTLRELFVDRFARFGIPCISGVECGHCTPTLTLPLGKKCTVDASNNRIFVGAGY